jgi:hypothetical protein
MKRIIHSVIFAITLFSAAKTTAQCTLQFANLVITPAADPVPDGPGKCVYTFNASFDIKTNSGFKYLFFHSWLIADYPNPSIFDCGNSNSQDPGTELELGRAVDDAGKSFMDIGFLNLNTLTFLPNNPVNVTSFFATTYPEDNDVVLTMPSNSPSLSAVITRKGFTDTLHFEVTNIKIIVNALCGTPIIVKTDIWGSNSNAGAPKAQCYICGQSQSFNDPSIALQKSCNATPFKYEIGLTTASITDLHVVYRLYADDLDDAKEPGGDDPLIFTSDTIIVNSLTPYQPGQKDIPFPYCCIYPWGDWGLFVEVTGREFSNKLGTQIVNQECATLPIKLKSFTAKRNRSDVTLYWVTETEVNNKGFDIERKIGNGAWEPLGFVDSKAVNGNSTTSLSYEFTDLNNTKGITQYRLKQSDLNGKIAYSLIRSVRGDGQKASTIIYPNPTRDGKVNIVFDDANVIRDVQVLDMNGRMIRQWKGITNNNLSIDNLITGIYTVRIVNRETGDQVLEKIVVQNR